MFFCPVSEAFFALMAYFSLTFCSEACDSDTAFVPEEPSCLPEHPEAKPTDMLAVSKTASTFFNSFLSIRPSLSL
jgi:hypothetical protein